MPSFCPSPKSFWVPAARGTNFNPTSKKMQKSELKIPEPILFAEAENGKASETNRSFSSDVCIFPEELAPDSSIYRKQSSFAHVSSCTVDQTPLDSLTLSSLETQLKLMDAVAPASPSWERAWEAVSRSSSCLAAVESELPSPAATHHEQAALPSTRFHRANSRNASGSALLKVMKPGKLIEAQGPTLQPACVSKCRKIMLPQPESWPTFPLFVRKSPAMQEKEAQVLAMAPYSTGQVDPATPQCTLPLPPPPPQANHQALPLNTEDAVVEFDTGLFRGRFHMKGAERGERGPAPATRQGGGGEEQGSEEYLWDFEMWHHRLVPEDLWRPALVMLPKKAMRPPTPPEETAAGEAMQPSAVGAGVEWSSSPSSGSHTRHKGPGNPCVGRPQRGGAENGRLPRRRGSAFGVAGKQECDASGKRRRGSVEPFEGVPCYWRQEELIH